MLLPAAAEAAKAAIAALSLVADAGVGRTLSIAEARGTGFSHSLPKS